MSKQIYNEGEIQKIVIDILINARDENGSGHSLNLDGIVTLYKKENLQHFTAILSLLSSNL